ncbi:PAS domain-containing protein [Porifericola rhodea]|uniref:PAS domain-containing protein n=1 Tax=Porifericola rhodea TaxID=930972 RepID=UPI002665DA90|nr:PAS domain-containing protein [Porifericola rhodea]WKN33668.1 PAS domain-containing protein [Porifericola rhodea]
MNHSTNYFRKKNALTLWLTEGVAFLLLLALFLWDFPYQSYCFVAVFVLQAIVVFRFFKKLTAQIQSVETHLEKLASGKLKEKAALPYGMAHTAIKHVNQLYTQMEEATHYIEKIGGRQEELEMLHLNTADHLGKALTDMRTKMQVYQDEEQKRNWSTEGHALFAEILREHNDDLDAFSNEVIQQIVKYLRCNQGSMFVLNDDEEEAYMELAACYAYDKRKYEEKRFKIGQGLVGQCAVEKQTIFMTDIPQHYVNITSGLGEATPSNLVIVPLIVNDKLHGVLELASFQKLEAYQLSFLEKVAESIASTLDTVKVTIQTKRLLDNSHDLTAELREREEVMREHLETLTEAQEEMRTQQTELQWVFRAMDNSLLTASFDLNGELLNANEKLLDLCGYSLEKLQLHSATLLKMQYADETFWTDMQEGIIRTFDFKVSTSKGEEKWINASFTPMKVDDNGNQKKILMLGTDITKQKLVLEKLSLVANNTDNSVIITDNEGYIEFVNEGFTKMTGYSEVEVLGRKPGALLQGPKTDQETVNRIRQKLKKGEPFYEDILNYRKGGGSYWISLVINPVKNDKGQIEKYISIQTDVSAIKETTLEYTYKLEAIGRTNAILDFDPEGNILDANAIFMSVTGYDKEELIGKPYDYLLPDSEKDKPQVQLMWDNLKEGTFFSGEFIQKSKEDKDLWLNGTFNPIFNLDGKLHKILMFAQFTTHEKEKQNELSSMLEALNKAVLTLEMDAEGMLKKANPLFLKTFGYKRSEIARKDILNFVKNGSRIPEVLKQLNEEENVSCPLTFITKEGEEKTYQATFNGMRNLKHELHRVAVILNEL